MTVYIDVLIVMNTYISYFTLRAAGRLLHTEVRFRRLAAASVLGGIMSLAAVLNTDIPVSLLLKAALTTLTVLAAFGFGSFRLFAVRSFVSIAVGMLICGAAVLVHEFTGSDFIFSANGYVYLNVSALVLVISSAVIYGVLSLLRRFFDSADADARVPLTIENLGSSAEINALADSGNFLRDFLTGRPVIICRKDAVANVIPPYLRGETRDVAGIRLIPMQTAAGSAVVAAFRPERITVRLHGADKPLDALIAVSEDAFVNESFDAVISSKLLK
ncbi:MAG: sigma-E processing peptidase SpoIIGA [Ruminiclostridium sp.]|nr:sigma-E processing peptidase SpoIIGA [Ruminiclostridium sp.]